MSKSTAVCDIPKLSMTEEQPRAPSPLVGITVTFGNQIRGVRARRRKGGLILNLFTYDCRVITGCYLCWSEISGSWLTWPLPAVSASWRWVQSIS